MVQKRTHLKHPKPANKSNERHWLLRFWMVLALLGLVSIGVVTYNLMETDDADRDVFVSVQTRTVVGNSNNVSCKLSLLIDPEQQKGIEQRRAILESVVNSVLADAYTGDRRPPLNEIKEQLMTELNKKLPRKLQIREVLLQELVIGNS